MLNTFTLSACFSVLGLFWQGTTDLQGWRLLEGGLLVVVVDVDECSSRCLVGRAFEARLVSGQGLAMLSHAPLHALPMPPQCVVVVGTGSSVLEFPTNE